MDAENIVGKTGIGPGRCQFLYQKGLTNRSLPALKYTYYMIIPVRDNFSCPYLPASLKNTMTRFLQL